MTEDILAQARAALDMRPSDRRDVILGDLMPALVAEVSRLRGLVANGMGKPGAVANGACGNCERPIAEGHSSLRCPCRPELEKLWAEQDEARTEVSRLRAQIERVRDLHVNEQSSAGGHPGGWCRGCHADWPCRTIQALDGEA